MVASVWTLSFNIQSDGIAVCASIVQSNTDIRQIFTMIACLPFANHHHFGDGKPVPAGDSQAPEGKVLKYNHRTLQGSKSLRKVL
jgi:hypothetical protein